MFSDVIGKSSTLSLLEIHKLRSDKLSKSRLFYGKKTLVKRHGNKALFLVNAAIDTANRLGCDPMLNASAKRGLGKRLSKNSRIIASACEAKKREK